MNPYDAFTVAVLCLCLVLLGYGMLELSRKEK